MVAESLFGLCGRASVLVVVRLYRRVSIAIIIVLIVDSHFTWSASQHAFTDVMRAFAVLRAFSDVALIVFGLIWVLFLVRIEVVAAAATILVGIVWTPCLDVPKDTAPKPNKRQQATPWAWCSSFNFIHDFECLRRAVSGSPEPWRSAT